LNCLALSIGSSRKEREKKRRQLVIVPRPDRLYLPSRKERRKEWKGTPSEFSDQPLERAEEKRRKKRKRNQQVVCRGHGDNRGGGGKKRLQQQQLFCSKLDRREKKKREPPPISPCTLGKPDLFDEGELREGLLL